MTANTTTGVINKGLLTQHQKERLVELLPSFFPPFEIFDDNNYTFIIIAGSSINKTSLEALSTAGDKIGFIYAVALGDYLLKKFSGSLVIQICKR